MTRDDDGPEVQEWDPEYLVRRGNYMTLVTPELAQQWLDERNTNNRKTKQEAITRYAREMAGGRWDPDASDIKFARTGELIDGQNRLIACTRAGVPFPTLIRTGLKLDTKTRVDTGIKRTIADTFTLERIPYANNVAAGIQLRLRYEEGEASGAHVGAVAAFRRAIKLGPDEALAYLREHPSHEQVGPLADQLYKAGPGVTRTIYFAFLGMAGEKDQTDAERFAKEILGADWSQGSPTMAWIRYLATLSGGPRTGSLLMVRNASERHLLGLVRCWNAWRMQETLDRIVIRDIDPVVPLV
jgi:hypothetical protein